MNNFELIHFGSDTELAHAVAGEWLKDVEAANPGAASYCVALSGGRITKKFFLAVAQQASTQKRTLNSVHFFWADERCVPPDDAESNFHVARERLFEPLRIPDEQIHRIRGEEPPGIAAVEAEAEICRIAPLNSDGQPVLDLIFLGLGEDGHVASLFPGEPESLIASQAFYRPVTAAKPPPQRITLGYTAIAAARQVWVLASGPGKEEALRESLRPDGHTPLARVLKSRRFTRLFSDIRFG